MMMNNALQKVLYRTCCVYIDDVIVWGKNLQEVLQRTEEVIQLLEADGLILSGLKSEFGLRKVKLLGKTI